jgi:hypothetical protein
MSSEGKHLYVGQRPASADLSKAMKNQESRRPVVMQNGHVKWARSTSPAKAQTAVAINAEIASKIYASIDVAAQRVREAVLIIFHTSIPFF